MSFLYRLLMPILVPVFFLRLLWKSRKDPRTRLHWSERLGFYNPALPQRAIWIHAVSVGETRATQPLVEALNKQWPDTPILMTHMTATGRAMGEQLFGGRVRSVYLPYDTPGAVARFLEAANPKLGLLMETELWPTLMEGCARRRIPLGLINARLSERSARGYARLGGFIRGALGTLCFIGAQTEGDRERLKLLGGERITVVGNLKFEAATETPDEEKLAALKAWLGPQRKVLLWASTREGEEERLLSAWQKAPIENTLIVLFPRHPNRFREVEQLLKNNNINYLKRSEWSLQSPAVGAEVKIVLGDSMGEMALWYALADLAFIGGSLEPLGGQNLLEALAQGCPILIGPHTFNFLDASKAAIESGVGLRVATADDLMTAAGELLADQDRMTAMRRGAKTFIDRHQGATRRTLDLLQPFL